MRTILLLTLIVCIAFFSACKKDDAVSAQLKPINLNSTEKKLVTKNNNFAFQLFNRATEPDKKDINILVSPLSVSYALGMTYNGANGDTKTAFENVLGFTGLDANEINENYKTLSDKLVNVDDLVKMQIANSIWYRQLFNVLPDFINTNKNYFNASVTPLDFAAANAKDIINKWVADNTNNKIDKIVDEISEESVMFLINAIYFNGNWKYRFNEDATSEQVFTKQDNSLIMVPTMSVKTNLETYLADNVQVAVLPYGAGNYRMMILMPSAEKSLDDFAKNFDQNLWSSYLSKLTLTNNVDIYLPKFKFAYERELNNDLINMGLGIAFTPNADFSKINGTGGLYISKVKHKTFIDVNEKGTEAAAVTSVEIKLTSVIGDPVICFNRPFMFLIYEEQTKAILFMGKVFNPLQN